MPRIKKIEAFPLGYPEPHDHGNIRYITLARVESEDGLVGWGECISQFLESALSVKTVIERGYAPLLVGEDPVDVERLWHKMLARIWWYGPQGIAAFAVSAVDLALWDLKGKLLGQPVCRLLGGQLHPSVAAMASIHFDMIDLDWTLNEFQFFVDRGYHYVKGGWGARPDAVFGGDRRRDLELVRRIRELIGPDRELIIDVLGARVRWTAPEAIRRLRELEPYRLCWIEEPLPPEHYAAHRELRAGTPTPIGTGEQEWNLEGYRRLIQAGGVDVVQMDPGRCHGITGCHQVIRLIEAANLQFSAHTWSGALNTAASVHLLAASRAGVSMDFKPHESPMQHELVRDPWVPERGLVAVRDVPGLGVTVDEGVVARYTVA
jgi:L-alanine-DL-glutamate epimerase-like enolase superfamily enzyme